MVHCVVCKKHIVSITNLHSCSLCYHVQCGSVEGSDAKGTLQFGKCKSCAAGTKQHTIIKYATSEEGFSGKHTDTFRSTRTVTTR